MGEVIASSQLPALHPADCPPRTSALIFLMRWCRWGHTLWAARGRVAIAQAAQRIQIRSLVQKGRGGGVPCTSGGHIWGHRQKPTAVASLLGLLDGSVVTGGS